MSYAQSFAFYLVLTLGMELVVHMLLIINELGVRWWFFSRQSMPKTLIVRQIRLAGLCFKKKQKFTDLEKVRFRKRKICISLFDLLLTKLIFVGSREGDVVT